MTDRTMAALPPASAPRESNGTCLGNCSEYSNTSLLDRLPDGVLLLDQAGRVLAANRALVGILGFSIDELRGRPVIDILGVSPGDAERLAAGVAASPSDSHPELETWSSIEEVTGRHRSGRMVKLEVSWGRTDDARCREYTAVIRDASWRKRAPRKRSGNTQKLRAVTDELAVLYRISSVLVGSLDLNTLLTRVLDAVTGHAGLNLEQRGCIFRVERDRMRLVAQLGHDEGFIESHCGMRVGDCLCGQVAQLGGVYISSRCEASRCCSASSAGYGPDHGHVIIPLSAAKEVLGVLCLYLSPGTGLTGVSKATLETMGQQIGMAMVNARLYEQARSLSLEDPLTKLGNRRRIELLAETAIEQARRTREPLALIMLDVDHLKKINDGKGHSYGDAVLVELGEAIRGAVRSADVATRYGGDEFLILLPGTGVGAAAQVAERIRRRLAASTRVTISVGIAGCPTAHTGWAELLEMVDVALYRAKHQGRNRICIADTVHYR
jgi:diguanylate cyclase (GGDEF)-like protein/PAS domain S-box-containing protein